MKQDVAKKWIKVLRSGKYKQTKGALRVEEDGKPSYCCLGVLCEVIGMKFHRIETNTGQSFFYGKDSNGWLPPSALPRTGMKSACGEIVAEGITLTDLNDDGQSFKQIANVIEKHWKDL